MSKEVIVPEFPVELIKYILVAAGIVVLFLYAWFVMRVDFMTVGIILGFILLGAVSRLPQRFNPEMALGLELVTIVTFVGAVLHGSMVGGLIGVLIIALSGFYTRERPQDIVVMMVGFGLIGYFAPVFYGFFGGLAIAVLAITVVYDLCTNFVYMFTGHSWVGCLRFSIVHIPANYFIALYLGSRLLGL